VNKFATISQESHQNSDKKWLQRSNSVATVKLCRIQCAKLMNLI